MEADYQDKLYEVLVEYDGLLPFRCPECGRVAARRAWDKLIKLDFKTKTVTDIYSCPVCEHTGVEVLTEAEFASFTGVVEDGN